MRLLNRFKQGELPLARLEAFRDGVFAIVVTLLVLELKVPALVDHRSAGEVWHQLFALLPKFLSWLINFVIVCKFWLNHHHIVKLARHADYGMVWLNSIFRLFQSFIPFPSAMMGEYPANPLAVSFFGVVMAVNTLAFIALHTHILRKLSIPEAAEAEVPHVLWKSLIGPASYLAGALATWISVPAGFLFYMVTPVFFITPPRRRTTGEQANAAHRDGQPLASEVGSDAVATGAG
jgi:uncharacterized membrane protein